MKNIVINEEPWPNYNINSSIYKTNTCHTYCFLRKNRRKKAKSKFYYDLFIQLLQLQNGLTIYKLIMIFISEL